MTLDEYKAEIEKEKLRHRKALRIISQTYAMSNNNVEIGDVVQDTCSKIKVDSIKWGYMYTNDVPMCIYSGVKLTKKDKPFKSGERDTVYQSNIVKKE